MWRHDIMCESSHDDNSANLASAETIEKIQRACKYDKISLGKSAQFNVRYWQIGRDGLLEAVGRHIDARRKIHRKHDENGLLLEKNFHANVTIYDGKDVYVEMILTNSVLVVLNAHEHTTIPRLPQ